MKSKLTIDLDHDNQPVIKIDYFYSEDVRDKMVKRFLETFGGDSCWAAFRYENDNTAPYGSTDRTAVIRPICNYDLPDESKTMAIEDRKHEKLQKKRYSDGSYQSCGSGLDIKDIDLNSKEGRLLWAAVLEMSTGFYTDYEPDKILEILQEKFDNCYEKGKSYKAETTN